MTRARHRRAPRHVRKPRDGITRERLLRAATRRFAEHGFRSVTVRDICRDANANVAAVNYHFGGKLGLYREVVRGAVDAMRETGELTMMASPDLPAADRLRFYVRTYLPRLASRDSRAAWIHKLMRHENSEPTPLAPWIAEQAILPRIEYLGGLVAELLHCEGTDPRVRRCVASIQAQCLFYAPNRFRAAALPEDPAQASPEALRAVADHIAEFSLAGIRRVARRG